MTDRGILVAQIKLNWSLIKYAAYKSHAQSAAKIK